MSEKQLKQNDLKKVNGGTSYIHYTVVRGDTLDSIANKFGTTKEIIMEINNCVRIKIGQKLLIPRS